MKTRIGFWLLGAAFLYLFGLPALRTAAQTAAEPRPSPNPFTFVSPVGFDGPSGVFFVVLAITLAFALGGGSGNAARGRIDSRDSVDRE